jgi:hypothetical protein
MLVRLGQIGIGISRNGTDADRVIEGLLCSLCQTWRLCGYPREPSRHLASVNRLLTERGLRSALTDPPIHAGGFSFCFCRARQAVDDADQGDAFGARPMQIWRPTAARTFFEGREGYCSFRNSGLSPRSQTH